MSDPISESLRAVQSLGADAFGDTALAADVGPTVRRVARRRVGRAVGTVVAAVALVAAVTVSALGYSGRTASPAAPPTSSASASGERVLIVVNSGDSASDVGDALASAGVIDSERDFADEAFNHPEDALRIVPGNYWLPRRMSASDAFAAMIDPARQKGVNVELQPRSTKDQIITQLSLGLGIRTADFYLAARDPASIGLPPEAHGNLAGWLGPYRYHFDEGATAGDALSTAIGATIAHLDELGVAPSDRLRVLTEASLIENLTTVDAERPAFARLIENRIAAGMPLPYGPGIGFTVDPDGTYTALFDQNGNPRDSYYLDPGLPPAPTFAPSLASIEAVVHPADGSWLYFTTGGPGTGETQFATTEEEYQRDLAVLMAWIEETSPHF